MVYEYNEEIENRSNNFADKKNFVGYILPDGTIYACKNHNVSNVDTFLKMYLVLLDKDYDKRNELLNIETSDKLAMVVLNRIKKMSYDEIHAFLEITKHNGFSISDLLVQFFGCHLVTRLKKEILTSETNHYCFYNYLLHNFQIVTIDKIIYNEEKKSYDFIKGNTRNDYLYDEIKEIKNVIKEDEISLFHKNR